ncbi:Rad2 nuclease [Exophiala xenobiotica]|uniref:Rad2 nuclease n=1 Tax=Lithohypha guttulata TaxID=1690604 RepID=A0ABR0KL98_9EURO|nr:Rad2 nuclease [Lithohypha guttulata]KAK5325458.1 Rad2 nuclease [Exophiala xenobiotica]
MGVSGLLPLLKSIHNHTTLKKYAGQTLGVDAFGWLHRGAVACSYQLAFDIPTTQYVAFVVNRVRMLLDFGITPYLVFDGDSVPSKAGTNARRRKEREEARARGLALARSGKKDLAQPEFQKAVMVTPQMTFEVIEAMRRMDVQILVAPYEADAQLAYLEKEGIIDGILSEDSDLLVFGVKKLITKLDQHGTCIEINRGDLILTKEVSFAGWSDSMFRRMAVLSGCDYLPSVNGVGLKTAHGFVKKHKEIARITRAMALTGKHVVPSDYLAKFADAERSFLYHRVFCPTAGKLVHLNTIPPDLKAEDMPYLGADVDAEVAVGVACGQLNPRTKEPFTPLTQKSIFVVKRPTLFESRRQTIGGSNDLKPKRSLDNFFKPQRRPLAELDPNTLTPSPSQQRLYERHRNSSWEPRLANLEHHSAPHLRRVASDMPHSSPATDNAQGVRASFLAKAAALSTYKPVKRQRLCSESDEVSPSKEVKQSKFFSPNMVENSPLASKKAQGRRLKKTVFDVFSDDSIDGIMLDLEKQVAQTNEQAIEYPALPAPPTTEEILEAADVVPQSSPVKGQTALVDSQSSHGTAELNDMSLHTQEDSGEITRVEVSGVDNAAAFGSLLDYHVKKQNDAAKARTTRGTFLDQAPEKQAAALAGLKSPQVVESEAIDDNEPEAEDFASPLRPSSSKFQVLARTFACQSPELQSRALRSLGKTPSISNISHALSPVGAVGSEDVLPPSSPARSLDEVSEAEGPAVSKLDLKAFQYIAS